MKKYFILIPLLIGLVSLFFFSAAYREIEKELYTQQFISIKDKIDLISIQTNRFIGETHPYEENLKAEIEYIDNQYMIYAGLYNKDFALVSQREAPDVKNPFDPMNYPEFKEGIKSNASGSVTLLYDDGMRDYNEMKLYYKWLLDGDNQNEYLLVAGITPYAETGNIAPWIAYGIIGLIGSLIILQIWMVIRISKMIDTEKNIEKKLKEDMKNENT